MKKSKKNESIWKKILNSVLKEKISAQGNVVLLGDANCGKKSLINGFKKLIKQEETTNTKMKNYYNTLYKEHGLQGSDLEEQNKYVPFFKATNPLLLGCFLDIHT